MKPLSITLIFVGSFFLSACLPEDPVPTLDLYYEDVDGDGFGDEAGSATASTNQPSGYVANNADCNDANSDINPDSIEVADGVDNNCDGQIDESVGSCKEILSNNSQAVDGVYAIDPDGVGGAAAFDVNCDMTRDGGGWTLFLKTWYQQMPVISGITSASGNVADGLSHKGNSYKLADADVRSIIGAGENFDVLADQSGYNSGSSTGNYEYVILRNYTGYWRFDALVSPSTTTTEFQSYRLSGDALAHTFNLECGNTHASGRGINCFNVLSNNPEGGAGCSINMGSSSSTGWHHFYMSEHNTDSYLYVCNGSQHSSSYDLNHRWWVRER